MVSPDKRSYNIIKVGLSAIHIRSSGFNPTQGPPVAPTALTKHGGGALTEGGTSFRGTKEVVNCNPDLTTAAPEAKAACPILAPAFGTTTAAGQMTESAEDVVTGTSGVAHLGATGAPCQNRSCGRRRRFQRACDCGSDLRLWTQDGRNCDRVSY